GDSGVRCRNKNKATAFTPAFAANQFLVFETVENSYDRAGADMHRATYGRGRKRTFFDNRAQANQLRSGNVAARRQLTRMQRNRSRNAAQSPQDTQIVRLGVIEIDHDGKRFSQIDFYSNDITLNDSSQPN